MFDRPLLLRGVRGLGNGAHEHLARGSPPRRLLGLEQVVERSIVTRRLPASQSVAASRTKEDNGNDDAGSQNADSGSGSTLPREQSLFPARDRIWEEATFGQLSTISKQRLTTHGVAFLTFDYGGSAPRERRFSHAGNRYRRSIPPTSLDLPHVRQANPVFGGECFVPLRCPVKMKVEQRPNRRKALAPRRFLLTSSNSSDAFSAVTPVVGSVAA